MQGRGVRAAVIAGAGVVLVAGLVSMSGCTRVAIERESGPPTQLTTDVQIEEATEARVKISMGAGELFISPGTDSGNLMQATFDFKPSNWEPEVSYDVRSGRGVLEVTQPRVSGIPRVDSVTNRWDIALAEGLPLEIEADLGAGTSELILGGLDVRDLELSVGAGDILVDLSGSWSEDVRVRIEGGAGSFKVRVPSDVGVRVSGARDGVGSFEADGFTRDGDDYVNNAYGRAPVTIEIRISRGVGETVIEQVD